MSKERLEKMLDCYRRHKDFDDTIEMIAILRDDFLCRETVNKRYIHDITSELATGEEHVLIYLADYVDILEQQNKRYREVVKTIEKYANDCTDTEVEMNPYLVIDDIKALEGESNG